jgi:hypothetical protein
MPTPILAEYRYEEPLAPEEDAIQSAHLAGCLEVREAKLVKTYLSRDRRRRISVFDAVDADTVRYAHRSANVPFESVWATDDSLPG